MTTQPWPEYSDVFSDEAISDEEALIDSVLAASREVRPDKRNSASRFSVHLAEQLAITAMLDRQTANLTNEQMSRLSDRGVDDAASIWKPVLFGRSHAHQELAKLLRPLPLRKFTFNDPIRKITLPHPGLVEAEIDVVPKFAVEAVTTQVLRDKAQNVQQPAADASSGVANDQSDRPPLSQRLLDALEYSTTDFRTVDSLARQLEISEQEVRRGLQDLGDKVRRPAGQERRYPDWWRLEKNGLTRQEKLARFKAVVTFSRMDDNY